MIVDKWKRKNLMNINIEDIEKLVQCLKDNNFTELE